MPVSITGPKSQLLVASEAERQRRRILSSFVRLLKLFDLRTLLGHVIDLLRLGDIGDMRAGRSLK